MREPLLEITVRRSPRQIPRAMLRRLRLANRDALRRRQAAKRA